MDELASSDVQVVLSIKEGRGFQQVLQHTVIIVTLNGHSLETDAIEPNSNPQYETDLVWEVDKSHLRKMRSGQAPLKLECFAIKPNGIKEKLGYLLLSIRSAQIVPRNTDIHIKANWYKLLGLKIDLKADKPELFLALIIRQQKAVMTNTYVEPSKYRKQNQESLMCDKIIPILLHGERLIQLGPIDHCRDLFLISITAISGYNINELLPKAVDVNTKDQLIFWCQILENDVYFKPFQSECAESFTLHEKIVVRVRSSLKVLRDYLSSAPFLFLYLKYKDCTIAESKIDLQPLLSADRVQEFLRINENNDSTLNQKCFLSKSNSDPVNEESHQKRPYLNIQIKIQYVGNKADPTIEPSSTLRNPGNNLHREQRNILGQHFNEIETHRNAGGDFRKYSSTVCQESDYSKEHENRSKCALSSEILKNQPIKTICSRSTEAVFCQCTNKDCSKSVEAYHCYCLNVSLTAIKLTSPRITEKNVEIRFHHPKSELMSTFFPNVPIVLGETIKLQDIDCKLHFVSAVDEIKHLLLSFPPKISIFDVTENSKTCMCQCVLDLKQLFYQDKCECQYGMPLYDTVQNKIGNLDVALSLVNHGPYYRIKRKTSEHFVPPIVDDSLVYKIVAELETWKEQQKEAFKVELKRKEERHLNLLSEEWQKHRESLESKLACSVEQCKMLANSLNNATEDLRTRRLKSLEKEARLIKANEDLQWRYDVTVKELQDSYRTMQEELTSKISALEKKKIALEAQIEPLTAESEQLRLLVTKQAEKIEIYEKGSLTQDQTANLLQELKTLEEKLHNAQQNKSFFKEQWAKAVREIHRMKMENQQAIQVQIKNSKEELENLNLEEMLCTDTTALTNDKILLEQIQKEINVMRPKSTVLENETFGQVFAPTTLTGSNIVQNNNKPISKRSDEYDERLKALIEERDSLLRTGSYTIDDTVIAKLNIEIRSLMVR